ncbi:heterokaryon incompatibility protein-domain-containing protein [Parachaetomium inaequale]|uniref:Heterokaryon incompatibility protein-domain-containing protein n=1 Tax=Parachaetomium inaequale TaxID=2588326 RepID=A0AAN6P440_9PEZI|nr:heterokaryon incompatibility protein-domain-containing protein [Parachaetomium inaequale]
MDLCFSCQRFNIHALSRIPGGWGTFQLKLAQDGARSGCPFCALLIESLWNKIPTERQSSLDQEQTRIFLQATTSRHRLNANRDCVAGAKKAALQIDGLRAFIAPATYKIDGQEPVKESFATFHVCAERGSFAATSRAIAGRFSGRDVQSAAFLEGIRDWLSGCLRHGRCCQTLSSSQQLDAHHTPLPTRCIDVTGDRLMLRRTADTTGSYITLSHRWNAQTASSQTTALNVLQRQETGFDLAELPQTFRDTIWLARQLDIPYVWIDSLCIIQGAGSTDWAAEAGKMAGYYQGSLFTIAAAAAAETDSKFDGLFPTTPPMLDRHLARLPFYDRAKDGVRRGSFYVYPARAMDKDYDAEVRRGALQRRGWVFQEWLLSRRLISYAAEGVYFECQTEMPRNALGDALIGGPAAGHRGLLTGKFLLKQLVNFTDSQPRSQYLWWDIVEAYSTLDLSFPETDRLLALSGIATEFQEARSLANKGGIPVTLCNVAGMWLEDIHLSLLWQQKDQSTKEVSGRLRSWIPSWSWASLVNSVSWAFFRQPHPFATADACDIVGLVARDGAVYQAPTPPSLPAGKPTADYRPVVDSHYPPSVEYTGLLIHCHLLPIHVWDHFTKKHLASLPVPAPDPNPDLGDGDEAASSTAIRKISLPNGEAGSPWASVRDVCGWATFEDPAFQDQRAFWTEDRDAGGFEATYALHVIILRPGSGWLERGLLGGGWKAVHMVLFVRRVYEVDVVDSGGVERYRRIGMGGMWGGAVERRLSRGKARTVLLV